MPDVPRTSFFEKKSALYFFAALIIVVTFFRFWYATQLELIGDEAYYWYCSRHLDWSFFDKGPGAAVTIWLGTHLFGDTVFGVRFFAVLLSAATGIALFVLARILFSQRVACWTLLVALFMPLYAVGSILMTIDPLSIFFWTLAAITFWKATKSDGIFFWILTGAFVGLGMLAKYTNLVELLCFAIFCCWSCDERRQFKRPHFYLMLAITCCFALPMVIWNVEHHGIIIFFDPTCPRHRIAFINWFHLRKIRNDFFWWILPFVDKKRIAASRILFRKTWPNRKLIFDPPPISFVGIRVTW